MRVKECVNLMDTCNSGLYCAGELSGLYYNEVSSQSSLVFISHWRSNRVCLYFCSIWESTLANVLLRQAFTRKQHPPHHKSSLDTDNHYRSTMQQCTPLSHIRSTCWKSCCTSLVKGSSRQFLDGATTKMATKWLFAVYNLHFLFGMTVIVWSASADVKLSWAHWSISSSRFVFLSCATLNFIRQYCVGSISTEGQY